MPSLICYRDPDIKLTIGHMKVSVLYINYEPANPSWFYGNHSHSSYELHYIPAGRGTLHVAGERYELGPGTFYLTGPGVYHEQLADRDDPMSEYCINFEFRLLRPAQHKSTIYIKDEVDALLDTLLRTQFWFGRDEYGSIGIFRTLFRELEKRWTGYYTVVQSLCTQIIINAARSFMKTTVPDYPLPRKYLDDMRRFKVDEFFRRCEQPLRPGQLAEQICVSVRQLDRIMQDYFGMSFKEKLTVGRLEKAKLLLAGTELPVGEIAALSGFSSSSYFCKLFKEREGCQPSVYRLEAGAAAVSAGRSDARRTAPAGS